MKSLDRHQYKQAWLLQGASSKPEFPNNPSFSQYICRPSELNLDKTYPARAVNAHSHAFLRSFDSGAQAISYAELQQNKQLRNSMLDERRLNSQGRQRKQPQIIIERCAGCDSVIVKDGCKELLDILVQGHDPEIITIEVSGQDWTNSQYDMRLACHCYNDKSNHPHPWQHHYSDYLQPIFTKYLKHQKIETVFELGCREGKDSLILNSTYGDAQIHAFECNPCMKERCEETLNGLPDIHFVAKAVWDQNTQIPFYPVVLTMDKNRRISNEGASSCFIANESYSRKYYQTEVTVDAIRLDSYCQQTGVNQIDLLCIDLQGAALHALRGLGDKINSVKWIVVELERIPIYHGQPLFKEVDEFLTGNGFVRYESIYRDAWFSDYLYGKID